MTMKRLRPAMDWIEAIVSAPPTDQCTLWPFAVDPRSGYGIVRFKDRTRTAHRVVLSLVTNQDPPDMQAAHGPCHSRRCCNPLHLSWKTGVANHADKVRDDTHNRGKRHYRAKLTPTQVIAILADPRQHKEIAAEYGVSRSNISNIKAKAHWKWVEEAKS